MQAYWLSTLFVTCHVLVTKSLAYESEDNSDLFGNVTSRDSRSISSVSMQSSRVGQVCPAVLFGHPSSCKSAVQCSPSYLDILRGPSSVCLSGPFSMCCPDIFFNKWTVTRHPELAQQMTMIIPKSGKSKPRFSEDGRISLATMSDNEKEVVASANRNSRSTPSGKKTPFQFSLSRATDQALAVIEATRALKRKLSLSPIEAGIGLQRYDVRDTDLRDACPAIPPCSLSNKFRTLDGSCNNRLNPNWGRAGTPVERILPPKYADGIWSAKKLKNGAEPPNARLVRSKVLFDEDHPWNDATHIAMQWGQFLDHDISHIPMFKSANDTVFQCCSPKGEMLPPAKKDKLCFEIEIPANDPFFGPKGVRCLNMVRSIVAPRADCRFGYADQMNTVSHFIDASHIYSNDIDGARKLRDLKGGRLRVQMFNGRPFTPEDPTATNCIRDGGAKGCFTSGDDRMNQVPGLTALHIIFLREHNRVVAELAKLNPRWGDDRLYEEGRGIIGAMLQRVTYNEYLPVVMGVRVMDAYGLLPLTRGYAHSYNEKVNPSITNEFTTAAFRMGHSLIQGDWHSVDEAGNWKAHKLRDWFNKPAFLKEPGQMDSVLRGMVEQRCQSADEWVSNEITNHLFQRPGQDHGFDLISINIRRGRDHALDGYNSYRQVCGLPRAKNFQDFSDVMDKGAIGRLRSTYADVDDVDLYVGGLTERPVPGGMVGPTLTCIIADQFARLKEGDRYFYENGGQVISFTPAQLEEIRKVSLARLMCDNADDIRILQPLVFRTPGKFNPRLLCSSDGIPGVNLSPWKE